MEQSNNIAKTIESLGTLNSLLDVSRQLIVISFLDKIKGPLDGNLTILDQVLDFVNQNVVMVMIGHAQLIHSNTDVQANVIYLDFELKKLQMVERLLPDILNTSCEKFFCLPINDRQMIELNNHIQIEEIDIEENIRKSLDQFSQMVYVGHAFASFGQGLNNQILRMLVTNTSGLFYLMDKNKARQQAVKILTNPTIDHIQRAWGIIEKSTFIKNFIRTSLDPIEIEYKIHIPKIFEPITLGHLEAYDYLTSLPSSLMFDRLFQSIYVKRPRSSSVKMRVLSSQKNIVKEVLESKDLCRVVNSLPKKHPSDQINYNDQQLKQKFIPPSCFVRSKNKNLVKKVIIHFHGGGFVAMSSFSHQTYTRKWANYLGDDTVVFSVDYRLAPQSPFPSALDDCWQSYLWIVYFAECYFNLSPEQIILSGDSAGGNFAMGVTIRAIQHKMRVPDGLFLMYPALVLNLKIFTPSLLKTLTDKIVPFSVLELCVDAYIPNSVDPRHIYVSPGLCENESILSKFPSNITIVTGSEDCLKDQSIDFVHRMLKIQKKPNLIIYKHFPHGFMNYAFPGFGLSQAMPVVRHTCQLLKNLFT